MTSYLVLHPFCKKKKTGRTESISWIACRRQLATHLKIYVLILRCPTRGGSGQLLEVFSPLYISFFPPFCIGQHFSQSFCRCRQGQTPFLCVINELIISEMCFWVTLNNCPEEKMVEEAKLRRKGKSRKNCCEISVGQPKNAAKCRKFLWRHEKICL